VVGFCKSLHVCKNILNDLVLQIATFDPTKKKKKKKKGLGFADDSVDKLTEKTENVGGRHELGKTIGIYLFLLF